MRRSRATHAIGSSRAPRARSRRSGSPSPCRTYRCRPAAIRPSSLGSVEGGVGAAMEPNLKAWFFRVGGGGIILEAASHAPGLGAYVGPFAGIEWSFLRDRFTETHLLVNLIQTILEPADPLTYAP